MTKLIPPKPKRKINRGDTTTNKILRKVSIIPVLRDLKAIISKLAFIRMTNSKVKKINPRLEITKGFKKEKVGCLTKSGSAPKKRAMAGVGNPLKCFIWEPLMLNRANRKAAPSGIKKPMSTQGMYSTTLLYGHEIAISRGRLPAITKSCAMMIPGATPQVTISAIESNCTPSLLSTLSKRAKSPSKTSKKTPDNKKTSAVSNWKM